MSHKLCGSTPLLWGFCQSFCWLIIARVGSVLMAYLRQITLCGLREGKFDNDNNNGTFSAHNSPLCTCALKRFHGKWISSSDLLENLLLQRPSFIFLTLHGITIHPCAPHKSFISPQFTASASKWAL